MYSPREIFDFLTTAEFREIVSIAFYKRHMESDDIKSPFNDPEKIIFLEWLIDHNYIIAEYRHDSSTDSESYLLSTLGHAFLKNYRKSWKFRWKAQSEYYKKIHWIVLASAIGSLIANFITSLFMR